MNLVKVNKINLFGDASAALQALQRHSTGRMKHLELQDLWLREKTKKGVIFLHKISGKANVADGYTKPLSGLAFSTWVQEISMFEHVDAVHLVGMVLGGWFGRGQSSGSGREGGQDSDAGGRGSDQPDGEPSPEDESETAVHTPPDELHREDWERRPLTRLQYEYACDLLLRLDRGEMHDVISMLVELTRDRPRPLRPSWASTATTTLSAPSARMAMSFTPSTSRAASSSGRTGPASGRPTGRGRS